MVNPSTAQARVVVDELIRGGVRDVVLCPGSRNAPLAFALRDADAAGRVRLHVRIDERTAGYLAIGLAVAGQAPVPIVMTSGTAVANLGPAVAEANYARVPLIVLSANRPYELLGTGANQTMEQLGYFDTQVRASISLGLAEEGTESFPPSHDQNARWRSAVCRVLVAATGARSANAGPVQFDIPLREPLVPDPEPDLGARAARTAGRAAVDVHPAGDLRPAAGHRSVPRHRGDQRARRGCAPQPGRAADRRRTHRAARRQPAAPAGAAAAASAAGDHARPPDAAPHGVVAAGRPGGPGVRADHRPALAGRLRQLAGHRHARGHHGRRRATAGCAAAPR